MADEADSTATGSTPRTDATVVALPIPVESDVEPTTPTTPATEDATGETGGDAAVEPPEPPLHGLVRSIARTVPGVHDLAAGRHRQFGRRPGRVKQSRLTIGDGVNDESSADETAIDVAVVIDYGHSVAAVGREVRTTITREVAAQTDLRVVAVNVDVVDVNSVDSDRAAESGDPR